MTKLEQMQERVLKAAHTGTDADIKNAVTEVWNEAEQNGIMSTMIKELLEQKKYWEQQLASTLNHRNNPFFRQTQWTTNIKKEDFDEQIAFEEKQIERIVNEIKTLTPAKTDEQANITSDK